jgi:cysteine-rich repeat protein
MVVAGRSGVDAVVLAPKGVSVGSKCPPGPGRLRAVKTRTKLTAQLPRCPGVRGPARLTATFQAGCDTLSGSIRLRRGGAARSIVARRQWCGDGTLDTAHDEQCDDADFGDQTCESLGFASGRLACTNDCKLDLSGCVPPTPQCGNGILDPGEQCDGTVQGVTCQSLQYAGGTIGCTPKCQFDLTHCQLPVQAGCGNGRRDPGEVCDGDDLGGAICPRGGTLHCQPGCLSFDTSSCLNCGDGRRDPGEACDGGDLGGATCQSLGDAGGPLACDHVCRFDRSGCFRCGNGRVDPGEECDDANTESGDGCSATCTSECGDGVVERGEECDDGNRADGDGCSALCVREHTYGGGGDEPNDSCTLDWSVEGSAAGALVTCQDGEPPCDRDDVTGQCTFLVFYCFNAAPLVGGGPPPCAPTSIARVELFPGSIALPTALNQAAQEAMIAAFATTLTRWGGASVTRHDSSRTESPPSIVLDVTPPTNAVRICGSFPLTIGVNMEETYAVVVSDSLSSQVDQDQLTFACAP